MDFDLRPLVWLFWALVIAAAVGLAASAVLGALILAGVL